jgi:glycosyltransferase involved in cell wall biosynthesis
MPQSQLAAYIQQAHALILYSRYETFGCVIIEANSCGLPAIVSDIPVFHEIIKEGINGYFVPANNPGALAKKILWFMDNHASTTPELISTMAREKYNEHHVGNLFSQFYDTAISQQKLHPHTIV